VQEVGTNQAALRLIERRPCIEDIIHVAYAIFERCRQIAVTPLEAIQYLGELTLRRFWVKRQHPLNDAICPYAIGPAEFAGLGSGLERAEHHSCWVGTQTNCMAFH
jgi:hypothetical protein